MHHSSILLILSSSFIVIGCNSDYIENKVSDYICLNAENKYINGEIGVRDVFKIEYGNDIDIGYSHDATLVNHSECAAAKVRKIDGKTSFSFIEYGHAIEKDGVTELIFFYKNGWLNIQAKRIKRKGIADEEFSERGVEYNSVAHVTKRIWSTEFPGMSISAVDQFDAVDLKEVTAQIGTTSKYLTWNNNSQQWNCSYISTNGNYIDYGCIDEKTLDHQFIGFELDLMPYFNSLSEEINYQTEPKILMGDVNYYL